jgi:hypothetical protein
VIDAFPLVTGWRFLSLQDIAGERETQVLVNGFNDFTVCDFAYLGRFDVNIVQMKN